jgi:hypothetical protein
MTGFNASIWVRTEGVHYAAGSDDVVVLVVKRAYVQVTLAGWWIAIFLLADGPACGCPLAHRNSSFTHKWPGALRSGLRP